MDLGLRGKRALVVASTRGLGLGVAVALAEEGADVILCGRHAERLSESCASITAKGRGRASWVQADLGSSDFVETVLSDESLRSQPIDILVNNSGGPAPGTAEDMTVASLEHAFRMMVVHPIGLTSALLPSMKSRRWGRVLTIASSGVVEPLAGIALSNTVRPALAGWSKTLATEVAPFGVTSNLLLPSNIATDRLDELDQAMAARSGRSPADIRLENETRTPMQRYGAVEEFAKTAVFLCSEPASYITGGMIRCDGGAIRSV